MKVRQTLVVLLSVGLMTLPARPQDRVQELKVDWQCNYYGEAPEETIYTFSSDREAEAAIDKILRVVGLARNFVIKAADVPNAAAVIPRTGRPVRYILYSQAFIRRVKDTTKTDWAALSIMAHELGHHLQGHTLDADGSRPPLELEADEFSGFAMRRMGATLEQSQAALAAFASEKGSATHPGRRARLAAIESGWTRAGEDVGNDDRTGGAGGVRISPNDPPALSVLTSSAWVEANSTLDGLPHLRRFESGGKVRSMTPADRAGYVPTNVSWFLSGDVLNLLYLDRDKKTLLTECRGTVKGDRIEGTCRHQKDNSTGPWLLTKVAQ